MFTALSGRVLAEDALLPDVGNRVRVHATGAESGPLVGTLTAVDDNSLTVKAQDRFVPAVVPRRDVSRLERSMRPSRKGKGALIGLGAGFVLGFAGTAILGNSSESGAIDHCVDVSWGSVYGAAVGAFGAGIGALVAPGERWNEVPINLVRSTSRQVEPPTGAELRVVPLLGRRQGLVVVVSFR
jgi:hypothetical protein